MLTRAEIFRVIIAPILVSAFLAAIAAWRRWVWMMPLAAAVGFFVGHALLGVPKLPPRDGSDWLFWLAIPLMAVAAVDALMGKSWGWIFAGFAGAMAWVLIQPLVPRSLSSEKMWETALLVTGVCIGLAAIAEFSQRRAGWFWFVMAFCLVTGAAGVVIFSSNLRTGGLYAMSAAAALGPVALLGKSMYSARTMTIFSAPLLAGLLVIGRFYPEPGVSSLNFYVLLLSPSLILIGALLPLKGPWMRGVIGLLLVMVAVAAVTGPTVLAAKRAAEDPYSDVYK